MRIYSVDQENPKKVSGAKYYIIAIIGAILLFAILWLIFNGLAFIVKGIIKYWLFVVGGLIAFILIKKFFSKKTMILKNENPYR
jgi:hypothetical protein